MFSKPGDRVYWIMSGFTVVGTRAAPEEFAVATGLDISDVERYGFLKDATVDHRNRFGWFCCRLADVAGEALLANEAIRREFPRGR